MSDEATLATKPISKMQAMRESLEALGNDAGPKALVAHLKATYNLEMSASHCSNYKTMLLKPKSPTKKPAKRAAKLTIPKVVAARMKGAMPSTNGHAAAQEKEAEVVANVDLTDVAAVKALIVQYGREAVVRLIDLMV